MKKFLVVLAVFVNGLAFGQDYGDSLVRKEFVSSKTIEYWMVRYINVERIKLGLDTLVVDLEPDQIAKTHSAKMLRTSIYEHSGLNIAEIIMRGGKGSNRYSHKFLAQGVINAWMESPGHRAHIINPGFKYIGTGYSYTIRQSDGYISYYYTATFR